MSEAYGDARARVSAALGYAASDLRPLTSRHATNLLFATAAGAQASVIKVFADEHAGWNERAALTMLAGRANGQIPRVLRDTRLDGRFLLELERLRCVTWQLRHDAEGHRFVAELAELTARVHAVVVPAPAWGALVGDASNALDWPHWLSRRTTHRAERLVATGLVHAHRIQALIRRIDDAPVVLGPPCRIQCSYTTI